MPVQKLTVRPGINTQATSLLNESGWSASQLVRFFQGYLQKIGGWFRLTPTPLLGTARALLTWVDANNNGFLIAGTEKALQVYSNGFIYNITPIATTDTVTPSFTTSIGSRTVKVTDAGNPAQTGNFVNIENPIAVGGLVLQGVYPIGVIVDANNYDITAASNATANATNTGLAALFTTTNLSHTVQVTLNNHGYVTNSVYTVFVSTTVATVVLFGNYNVASVIDANNFTIAAASAATSGTTGSENGGNVTLQYLLPTGALQSLNQDGLYGQGSYGGGLYGFGDSETFVPARLWSFGYWGTDVVASYTGGSVYTWISESGFIGNPATIISTSPVNISAGIFTAMPQQQVVALGASDGSSSNPDLLLVRWSDVGDNTDWTATATNQAGSFRISRGAQIVGGMQGPQAGLIWTDVGLWLMQYIGFPLVYGFTEIAQGCGLIGQNAKGVLGGKVYWMSYNGFFVYDGNSVQPLACPVWDKIFQNLEYLEIAKIIAAPNSFFNEMSWCYQSVNNLTSEVDSRVTYNTVDGTWTYDPPGAIVRTAWLDQSIAINPIGVDGSGVIQEHEIGNDANDVPIVCYAQTGFFKIAEGLEYTFIERLIPDAILQNSENRTTTLQITLYFQDYPNTSPIYTVGPLTFTQAVSYLIVRGRGRFVSIRIGSNDAGSFWRLGEMLYFGSGSGRR